MPISQELARRPEFLSWVRKLEIENRLLTLSFIEKGYLPKTCMQELRLYMQNQIDLYLSLAN